MCSRWKTRKETGWTYARSPENLRFAIVGAGAIGCLFGAKLTLAGQEVELIHRRSSVVQTIQKKGVRLQEINGRVSRVRVPARRGPTRLTRSDVVIVAVKSYNTGEVAASYRGLLKPETTVLSLQNGLGNIETLQAKVGNDVLAGSTTEGALSRGLGSVVHTGKGLTVIGDPRRINKDICHRIKAAFDSAEFPTKISSNIRGVLWTKAIVNSAINPLSSLTRLPNGALARNAWIQRIARMVIDEGMSVSHASGVRLVGDPRDLWHEILWLTRANKSSMLQDVEKRKMTEIRQLNGAILSHGKKTRIKIPINEILMSLILGLEESYRLTLPRS